MGKIGKNIKLDREKEFSFPHSNINTKPFHETFHAKHSFMGAYLDKKLVDLAFLYCAYTGKSKTQFLKESVQERSKEFPSEKEMMKGICENQLDHWIKFIEKEEFANEVIYEYNKKKIWEQYKKSLKRDLGKILPKYYLNYVISYIEDAQF
jgi:hypothetical protein